MRRWSMGSVPTLVLVAALGVTEASGEPLTVERAIAIGLERHPSLAVAEGLHAQAVAEASGPAAGSWPTVEAFAGVEAFDVTGSATTASGAGGATAQSLDDDDHRSVVGLRLEQRLYDFGGRSAERRRIDARAEAAEAARDRVRLDVVAAIEAAYWELGRARERHAWEAELAERIEGEGARRRSNDSLRARARGRVAEARAQVLDAEAVLRATLGLERTLDEPLEPVVFSTLGLTREQAVNRALGSRPAVREARAEARAGRAGDEGRRAARRPTVSAFVSAQRFDSLGSGDLESLTSVLGGLAVRGDLGTAFRGTDRLRDASERIEVARTRDVERAVALEAERAYVRYAAAVDLARRARELSTHAERRARTTAEAARRGRASSRAATEALEEFRQAALGAIDTTYAAKVAEVRLARALGGRLGAPAELLADP